MPVLRKIVFYIFAAIYLVVCPLLILRLLGYLYNPQTHRFVKTGIIYASTNPPGADVFINNLKAHETTPTIIRDLPPDNYTVKINLQGYQEWQNTVPVAARKATALENILLTPPQWTIKALSPLVFRNMLSLGDENSLLVWNKETIKELYLLKLNKNIFENNKELNDKPTLSKFFSEEFIYGNAQIIRFFTAEKSPFFIMHILADQKDKYLWVDAKDKQIHIEDISDLLPEEPERLWWEPGDEKIIYAFYTDHINRIDIKAKAIYPDISSKDLPIIKKPTFDIANLKGSVPNENKNSWLLFTSDKIGIWEANQKSLRWIFEKGRNIQQVFWANNASTILFQDNNQIFLLDKDFFAGGRIQKITNIQSGTSFFYSEKTGKIYFIDAQKDLLSFVQLLGHTSITPRIIADKLSLKELSSGL